MSDERKDALRDGLVPDENNSQTPLTPYRRLAREAGMPVSEWALRHRNKAERRFGGNRGPRALPSLEDN